MRKVSLAVQYIRRVRKSLKKRLKAIRRMRSFRRPGKRGDRLRKEHEKLLQRLSGIRPWNVVQKSEEVLP